MTLYSQGLAVPEHVWMIDVILDHVFSDFGRTRISSSPVASAASMVS
ncbi:hypothetical protein HUW62_26065 [Myxococcus sp. AM011]|nr:hypothetical protein [Myxococcus sp. AM011]NVJ24699.1 hypothetical protein [Myxococcus sp. AM011]